MEERAGAINDLPLLEVRGLTKRFGGVVAVDGCDLSVRRGDIHSLIGPNGSGKTTTLNAISGIVAPTSGSILLRGAEISGLAPNRIALKGVARTFQNIRLFEEMSVLDNLLAASRGYAGLGALSVLYPFGAARRVHACAVETCDRLLDTVGLLRVREAVAGTLPYGDRRRLEIARALASAPSLLLLDEPAAGMNGAETDQLTGLLLEIRREGVTILLIEHDMNLVMRVSDIVTVLNFGTRIATGPPREVREDAAVIDAYLGRADDAP